MNWPLGRVLMSYAASIYVRIITGMNIKDATAGFKCYKRHTIDPIFSRQLINGWVFDAEDVFLAKKFGFKIKEIPINWTHYARDSKVRIARDVLKSALELLKIRINDLRGRYT